MIKLKIRKKICAPPLGGRKMHITLGSGLTPEKCSHLEKDLDQAAMNMSLPEILG